MAEVYTASARLLGWSGGTFPSGGRAQADTVPPVPQTSVRTGEVRDALVAWAPVVVDGTTVGAVRVVRTIRYQPPVQNRYLQGFSLVSEWEQATGETVRVSWSGAFSSDSTQFVQQLASSSGRVLGTATVAPPSDERLVERAVKVYNDGLAAGLVLLMGWGLVVGVLWYRRLAERPGIGRHDGALTAATGRFACAAVLWVGARYVLLMMDIPARWVEGIDPFPTLFTPTRLASPLGGGIFRSVGDLFLTGGWAVVLAVGLLHLASRYRLRVSTWTGLLRVLRTHPSRVPSAPRLVATCLGLIGASLAGIVALAYVVRRTVLDSTLDFFARTGLLPEPLVLVVLCALFLLVVAIVLGGVALSWIGHRLLARYRPPSWARGIVPVLLVSLLGIGIGGVYLGTSVGSIVPFPYPLAVMTVVAVAAIYGLVGERVLRESLTLRGILFALFVLTLLLYPLLYAGMDAQRRGRMVEAARSFEAGYDPRVLYSIRQVLRAAETEVSPLLDGRRVAWAEVDSMATGLVRRSLVASLTTYEVSLSILGSGGGLRRHYTAAGREERAAVPEASQLAFTVLRPIYELRPTGEAVIERLSGRERGARTGKKASQYVGLIGVRDATGQIAHWVLLRAEPRSLLPGTGPGVPRVLLPDGSFSDLYADLSLAEFRDQTLVRSFGRGFGRTRLRPAHDSLMTAQSALWRTASVQGRRYLTYYHRQETDGAVPSTVAVRIPSILAFDHLYYLLRLTVAGLGVGLVFYLLGLLGRYRYGVLPAPKIRFRDKVLDSFLVVGVVSMAAVGVVGVQVVTSENERVVERRLQDHLSRVEEALALQARSGEPLWRAARRANVDSLAARVGIDLRFYEEGRLVGTSRPRLVRDGLVDERLPGTVYRTLYNQTYRFVAETATVGQFRYRVGYQALADTAGTPRFVVAVPTLAQQERVEEEQTRTLAYLFGALLLLLVMVVLTAIVLANALAQPIARLRKGLEAVGEGRFTRVLPVETRDEIGDLVRTFNEMRDQLAESRRKLAQQERELAWREMARQVAHEIKNPLTPMKLSIQHLRRAFQRTAPGDDEDGAFTNLFDRITTTLIEQIESLVRIADEFSTFARLPTRVVETMDLNEVVQEAARLMDEESEGDPITLDLHPEPLVVEADREELRRIYINLLKNALQAVPDDRAPDIRVQTSHVQQKGRGGAESRVADNGTGIPPEQQDKIFEPNFSTKTSGTGLGLAIVQKSLDELDGAIGFKTEEGAGTTFWIRLPVVAGEETEG
jgi:signal transduction histidine kinase